MKLEDFRLIIIKDGDTHCAYMKNKKYSGMLCQVENIEDIPKSLSQQFEAMLTEAVKREVYDYSVHKA